MFSITRKISQLRGGEKKNIQEQQETVCKFFRNAKIPPIKKKKKSPSHPPPPVSHQEVLSFISIKSFGKAGNPTCSGQPPSPPGTGGGAAPAPPTPGSSPGGPDGGEGGGAAPPPSPRSVRGCREPAERQIPFVIKLSKSHFEGSARALQINRLLGLIAARRGLEVGAREQPHASKKG